MLVEPRKPYRVKAGILEVCNDLDTSLGLFVISFDMCKYFFRGLGPATRYISRKRLFGFRPALRQMRPYRIVVEASSPFVEGSVRRTEQV